MPTAFAFEFLLLPCFSACFALFSHVSAGMLFDMALVVAEFHSTQWRVTLRKDKYKKTLSLPNTSPSASCSAQLHEHHAFSFSAIVSLLLQEHSISSSQNFLEIKRQGLYPTKAHHLVGLMRI